jgi:hypothetical protein
METPDEMEARWDREIKEAGALTEEEMREQKPFWPKSIEELVEYINSLIERPHSYGTCVYAMSYAAASAYYYVSHKLGVSGFQAGCAEMDFLRLTRHWEWGRILDYNDLLFPQYCNEEKFPSVDTLLNNPEIKEVLAKKARQKLASGDRAHPNVIAHWEKLASLDVE